MKRLAQIISDQEQRCPWRGARYQLPRTGDLQIEQPRIKIAAVRRLVHRSRCQEANRQPNARKLSSTRHPRKPDGAALKHFLGGMTQSGPMGAAPAGKAGRYAARRLGIDVFQGEILKN
jgi:hypothetical protein